jgi:hypothetical protein
MAAKIDFIRWLVALWKPHSAVPGQKRRETCLIVKNFTSVFYREATDSFQTLDRRSKTRGFN